MMRHALVKNGVVFNVVVGDKPHNYPDSSHEWILLEGDNSDLQIGWREQPDGSFAPPPPPPPEEDEE